MAALFVIGSSDADILSQLSSSVESISDDLKDFVSQCMQRDAKDRLSVEQLLQHKFLNSD